MLNAIDPVAQIDIALLRVLVAGLLGGLIGVERERSAGADEHRFAGVRTFPLFAMLGAGLTLVSGGITGLVIAGFVAVAALAVASYVHTSQRGEFGTTTETAALATYALGVMAGAGALALAGALGIAMAVLLMGKQRLEAFPRTLSGEEMGAALTLAVLAVVILPLLPDANYGPWGVWNPRELWGMVVLVCGMSFAAFVAVRLWGGANGLYVSGVLGGLVSSTAVTVSFATQSVRMPAQASQLAVGTGLACLVMILRIAILSAVAGPAVLPLLAPFLGLVAAAAAVAMAFLARRPAPVLDKAPPLTNPFRLKEALKFTLMYALVLLVVEAARRYLGSWGLIVAAVLAGFTDVDAITLSLAGLTGSDLDPATAASGIAVAALSNTVAKAGYAAWLGSPGYRRAVAAILAAAFVAGVLTILVLAPRTG